MERLLLSEIEKKYAYSKSEKQNITHGLKEEIDKSEFKIIVLDDDPTGVQTVHDIYVYTDWDYVSVLEGFKSPERLFYILTNSRGLTEAQTEKVHREVTSNIIKASVESGMDFLIISRGDSTLRGHFPLETQVVREEIEKNIEAKIDGEIIAPFFLAGGRYTINNCHYIAYGDELVPVAETEFAKDKTFGYTKSNLCDYVEEKTKGEYGSEAVATIGLEALRRQELGGVEAKLMNVHSFNKVIVNAIEPADLECFCIALYRAIEKGKRYIFRTAADFVKTIGGIPDKELLTKESLFSCGSKHGGMIVIGSHTKKTTMQLEALRSIEGLAFVEFDSDLVIEDRLGEEVERVNRLSRSIIEQGRTVVVYTKRRLLSFDNDTKEGALMRSVKISESVLKLVSELETTPAFVLAKGGITSSDIGVKALKVRKAYVLGQIQPGIPVWRTDDNSRFPFIPYIIFPGNVGEEDTLKKVVESLIK